MVKGGGILAPPVGVVDQPRGVEFPPQHVLPVEPSPHPAAACRSDKPSAHCRIVASANRHGASAD